MFWPILQCRCEITDLDCDVINRSTRPAPLFNNQRVSSIGNSNALFPFGSRLSSILENRGSRADKRLLAHTEVRSCLAGRREDDVAIATVEEFERIADRVLR